MNTYRPFLVLALALVGCLAPSAARAQSSATADLQGIITVAQTEEALDFASIALLRVADSSVVDFQLTDEAGRYAFKDAPAGEPLFARVSRLGYDDFATPPLTLEAGKSISLPIQVSTNVNALEVVEVTAHRDPISFRGGEMLVAVDQLPNVAGSNAVELLGRVPGVDVNGDALTLNGFGSVNVLINGRKRTMTVAQTLTLLRGIPASEIQSISVRSGKSVRQDASGTGGEINIITKRTPDQFYNISLRNRLSVDQRLSNGHSIYLNLNGSRLRFNGGVSYDREFSYGRQFRDETYTSGLTGTGQTEANFVHLNRVPVVNFNVEYDLSERARVGLAGNSYFQVKDNTDDNLTSFQFAEQDPSAVSLEEVSAVNDNLTTGELYYERDLDSLGSSLRGSVSFMGGYSRETTDFTRRQPPGLSLGEAVILQADLPLDGAQLTARLDYEKYLSEQTQLSFGMKASDGSIQNLATYDTVSFQPPRRNLQLSDSLRYDERVAAVYGSFTHSIGDLSFEGGARYEYTLADARSLRTGGTTVRQRYGNIFPNAAVSYRAGDNYRFSLSYSKSITRPNYLQLNPYVRFLDAFTRETGNGQLLPELSHRTVLTAQLFQFLYLNFGHIRGERYIGKIRQLQADGLTTLISPENAYGIRATYAQATAYYRFGKDGKYSGRFGGLILPLTYLPGEAFADQGQLNTSTTKITFSSGHRVKLTERLMLEGEYYFVRGRDFFQGRSLNLNYFNAGFTYELPGDHFTLSGYVTDIFNRRVTRGAYFYPGYAAEYENFSNTRRGHLTLTYRIGSLKKSYGRGPGGDIDRFRQ